MGCDYFFLFSPLAVVTGSESGSERSVTWYEEVPDGFDSDCGSAPLLLLGNCGRCSTISRCMTSLFYSIVNYCLIEITVLIRF